MHQHVFSTSEELFQSLERERPYLLEPMLMRLSRSEVPDRYTAMRRTLEQARKSLEETDYFRHVRPRAYGPQERVGLAPQGHAWVTLMAFDHGLELVDHSGMIRGGENHGRSFEELRYESENDPFRHLRNIRVEGRRPGQRAGWGGASDSVFRSSGAYSPQERARAWRDLGISAWENGKLTGRAVNGFFHQPGRGFLACDSLTIPSGGSLGDAVCASSASSD